MLLFSGGEEAVTLFCPHTAVVVRANQHQIVRQCDCPAQQYSDAEIAHKLTGIPIADYQLQEQ